MPLRHRGYNRYERELLGFADSGSAYARSLAEASRQTRRAHHARDATQRAQVAVAAGVAAPFLVSYVSWLLAWALQQRVDRLYFLARDGQVLLRIAQRVAPSLRVECDLRYLQGSRVTFNLAAASELTDETLPWLLTGLRRQSVLSLCERLHLKPDELSGTLQRYGISPDRWAAPLGRAGAATMQDVIGEPSSLELIRTRAAQVRERTVPYLRYAGFLDPGVVGIVDLGGAGSQLQALGAFRQQAELSRPIGYLVYRERSSLGDQDRAGRVAGCSQLHVYLADDAPGNDALVTGFVPMLEAFCAADHGRVIDYHDGGSSIEAVTDDRFGVAVRSWGLPTARAAMDDMISRLVREGKPEALNEGLIPTLLANLQAFIRRPTPDEARAWGRFPVGTGELGATQVLGPTIALRAVGDTLRSGRPISSLSRWWPGSLARSPLYLRIPLAAIAWMRRWRREPRLSRPRGR